VRTSRSYRQFIAFALSVASALLSSQALAAPHSSIDRIIAFGTSLTDTGNAFIWLSEPENRSCGTALNVPPYDALDDLLIPDGPYAVGGHHFTNGDTWVEGMARYLALSGNVRPALQNSGTEGTNYAVGGARAVAGDPCRFNLPEQVGTYLSDFPQTSPHSLVVIEIGGNDVRDALVMAASGQDPAPTIVNALGSLAESVGQLYAHGARKFLILNVPDIGKTPAVRGLGQTAVFFGGLISANYNAGLASVVSGLQTLLPGIDMRILDIDETLNEVVANPGTYGFVNATDACVTPNQPPFKCAKPDTYVFWDGIHPTKALHAIVAQQAISVISAH
jgi:phospholipase/lecithinase/hemolysin